MFQDQKYKVKRGYEFGQYILDAEGSILLRHPGIRVSLRPKLFNVLLMLIEHPGELISYEDLLNNFWPDEESNQESVTQAVSEIRKILGGSRNTYIETVRSGKGYRFVAAIKPVFQIDLEKVTEGPTDISIPPAMVQKVIEDPAVPSPKEEFGQDHEPAASDISLVDQVTASSLQPSLINQIGPIFRGYSWYILVSCAIYASHYMITLLLEVAYKFDVYGTRTMIAAPIFFCWILITSIGGLVVALKLALKGKGYGLVLSASIFVAAAIVAFLGAWFILPHIPITQAKFQTYAAPAAYLKDIAYILPIVLLFLVVPFHFVVILEQEIKQGRTKEIFELLSGSKLSIRPTGTIYIKVWVLGLLLAGWLAYSLAGRAHLFDNLLPSPYLFMFEVFHQTRTMLQFALGLYCITWYYSTLNRLKSKCLTRID